MQSQRRKHFVFSDLDQYNSVDKLTKKGPDRGHWITPQRSTDASNFIEEVKKCYAELFRINKPDEFDLELIPNLKKVEKRTRGMNISRVETFPERNDHPFQSNREPTLREKTCSISLRIEDNHKEIINNIVQLDSEYLNCIKYTFLFT